jgi:small subunit ribosomal protein S17
MGKEKIQNMKSLAEGLVVSDKMDKTIVVAIDSLKAHPKYLKKYVMTKKYKAHDPENRFKVGDKVKIRQAKPRSKGKKWEAVYNEQGTMNNEQ